MSDKPAESRVRAEWAPVAIAVFVGSCLAVLLILLLYRIRGVFLPFLLGFFIAYVLDPLLDRLEARGWSRVKAVWVVTALFFLIVGTIIAVVVVVTIVELPQATADIGQWGNEQVRQWEKRDDPVHRFIEARVRDRMQPEEQDEAEPSDSPVGPIEDAPRPDSDAMARPSDAAGVADASPAWPQEAAESYEERVIRQTDRYIDEALTWLDDRWADWAGAAVKQLGAQVQKSLSFLFLLLLIPLIAFHFMTYLNPFRVGLGRFVPEAHREQVFSIAHDINNMLGRYLRGLGVVSLANGAAATVILMVLGSIFGTEYWLVVGAITGITYCVPWLGPTLSTLSAGVIGIATADHHHLLSGLLAAAAMIALNVLFDNVVMPRIVGRKVGLHPLAILFGIMAGYAIWGILGMIVAVPCVASINIALMHILPAFREVKATSDQRTADSERTTEEKKE